MPIDDYIEPPEPTEEEEAEFHRKQRWINEVHALLCKAHGGNLNEKETENLRGYAEAMASEEAAYFQEGLTPQEAFDEEASCQ